MKMLSVASCAAVLVLASSCAIVVAAQAQTTPPEWNAAFGALEAALGRLGSTAEQRYRTVLCPDSSLCGANSTSTCTLPACGEDFSSQRGFQCLAGFGTSSGLCGCAQGLRRSATESTLIIPPDSDFAESATQRFVCATKAMDAAFRSEYAQGTLKGFQYAADLKGVTRVFPGMAQERNSGVCDTFDVRRRPWFASALSGPKNVVFVIDSSGSMGAVDGGSDGVSRMQLVKTAMGHLLQTLTARDSFDVVDFDSSARSLGNGLTSATPERVEHLRNLVNGVSASGGTYFAGAFRVAFEKLALATTSTTCRNIIVFLTDGQRQDDEADALRAGQASLPEGKKAHIMTFSMSDGADQSRPRSLACEHRGVWTHIGNNDNVADKLVAYSEFLQFATVDDTVRWSSPYLDAFGLGYTVTAARTITAPALDGTSEPVVVGIVAADLPLASVVGATAANDPTLATQIDSYLNTREASARCPSGVVTECKLEQLRQRQGHQCLTGAAANECAAAASANQVSATACPASSLLPGGINGALCTALAPTTRIPAQPTQAVSRDLQCCSRPVDFPITVSAADAIGGSTCGIAANGSAAGATAAPAPEAALEAFDLDPRCERIASCERVACRCLNPVASYDVNGSTAARRCPGAASASSMTTCAHSTGCVSELAACVRTLWNSYSISPASVPESCQSWGQRIRLALLAATSNGTAAARAVPTQLCEQSFTPWSCLQTGNASSSRRSFAAYSGASIARRQAANSGSCLLTACDVGCDSFRVAAPAPTPAPPGPGTNGGVSFGRSSPSTTPSSLAVLAVAIATTVVMATV